MKKEGYDVVVKADLCRMVMQSSSELKEMATGVMMACYPRVMRSHFDWLGIENGQFVDIRNHSSEEVLQQFNISCSTLDGLDDKEEILREIKAFPVEEGTDAWYPVLDKTKCTECGKCHDFCLFGVYTVENKQVKVVQPQNCKNNCPACARMCPNKAIIFPKYEKSPINGGIDPEETFDSQEMDIMYRERLRMKLQQRRASVPLLKEDDK
ncbi:MULTISPECIES: ferredoxin family protein [unclassified Parabacteroides]|uniref:ATP-binding protein n=1 Tax=unclassified Parabacteroides TaxID=2649774 RepID=UPI002474E026|nr:MULTISPECIES: ferredoxin family protein [unclassified Parabacteroides]